MQIIVAIVIAIVIAVLLLRYDLKRRRNKQTIHMARVLKSNFNITDRLDYFRYAVLFDAEKRQVALVGEDFGVVLPYDTVRRFSYEPIQRNNGRFGGWMFRVQTSNPKMPLHNIPMLVATKETMEMWLAKFEANVRG